MGRLEYNYVNRGARIYRSLTVFGFGLGLGLNIARVLPCIGALVTARDFFCFFCFLTENKWLLTLFSSCQTKMEGIPSRVEHQ